jgi:cephalosporin hydroxylase
LLHDRLAQHTLDFYAGIPIEKFPEDLRVYEHLLWWTRPEAVVEVGTSSGGSALWFRDRLRTLERYGRITDPLVVSIDIDMTRAREWLGVEPQGIVLLEIDSRSPELTSQVAHALGGRTRCLVVEDSAHVYDTTRASLDHLSKFVEVGGFFVVEDAVVDEEALRIDSRWPRGVRTAIDDWLSSERGSRFHVRRDLELYGLTCHPGGFLQRTAP